MNAGYQNIIHTTSPPLNGNTGADSFLLGLGGYMVFTWLFGIILFVIWVWSMIAMINLNSRFKDFYEYYIAQNNNRNGQDMADHKIDDLRNYKTEEEKKAEHRAWINSMKPRKVYLWIAAVGIPVLLIILILAPKLFR